MKKHNDFTSHLTLFCRLLRDRGLLVGPREIIEAIDALTILGMMNKDRVYWTLRTVLVSRHEEIGVFDQLFHRFWVSEIPTRKPSFNSETKLTGGMKEFRRTTKPILLREIVAQSKDSIIQMVGTGASDNEVNAKRDLDELGTEEVSELSRIAARVIRALASRPGRRRRPHKRKGKIDLRRALRLSLGMGGEPIRLPRKDRLMRIPRLLLLLDVSGSMNRHTRLLLQLAYAITQHKSRIETFVFSTSVSRVTRQLKASSFHEALKRVGRVVSHWSGGTRIGASLSNLNTEFMSLQDRYTTVILLSDGWDTGDPAVLASEMRSIHRRVRRIIWLNPHMGTEAYEPLTRGLQAAIPFVDHFGAAVNLNSLKRLPKLLRSDA